MRHQRSIGDPSLDPTPSKQAMFRRIASNDFEAYRDLYAVASTVSKIGDRFEATVVGRRAAGLLLFDRQIAGAVHQREATRIRCDDLEHINVQVLRSGRMLAGLPGTERLLAPGDAVLFDTTLPQRTVLHDADYVTVSLPRDVVEAVVPDIRSLHGLVLPRNACPALGEAVLSLARGESAPSGARLGGGRLIAGLMATATGQAGGTQAWRKGDDEDAEAARRLCASLFIDAHLGRHDLDVSAVASGSGLSRSALYRAFAPVGGIEGEIVRRRVARLRSAILRSSGTTQVSTLAWNAGFTSRSHCSRAFKAAYGLAPKQFRDAIQEQQESDAGDLRVDHLRGWIQGLNGTCSTS